MTLALGVRYEIDPDPSGGPGLTLLGALEYARWSESPGPDATVNLDLDLGVTPSEVEARFPHPRFRDTLSPRLGVELKVLAQDPMALPPHERRPPRLVMRFGWSVSPSPVPDQVGLTSHADATRHTYAFGAGWHFGRPLGVELKLDVAAQKHDLNQRRFDKPDDSLPFAHYTVDGSLFDVGATLGATWR